MGPSRSKSQELDQSEPEGLQWKSQLVYAISKLKWKLDVSAGIWLADWVLMIEMLVREQVWTFLHIYFHSVNDTDGFDASTANKTEIAWIMVEILEMHLQPWAIRGYTV